MGYDGVRVGMKEALDIEECWREIGVITEFARRSGGVSSGRADQVVSGISRPLDVIFSDLVSRIDANHRLDGIGDALYGRTLKAAHYTATRTVVSLLNQLIQERQRSSESSRELPADQLVPDEPISVLRLYDAEHLNDPDEGYYLIDQLDSLKDIGSGGEFRRPRAYLASFVLDSVDQDASDDLILWNAYGDRGRGCSVSISVPVNRLRKVVYGREGCRETISLIDSTLSRLVEMIGSDNSSDLATKIRDHMMESFLRNIGSISYLYKAEYFEYENEARVIAPLSDLNAESIKFEVNDGFNESWTIRHYVELPDLSLRSLLVSGSTITVGPGVPYQKDVMYSIETMLRNAGMLGTDVKISGLRYRPQ